MTKTTTTDFTVIIPARKHSTRLPNKMLLPIAGRAMVEHVYRQACQSNAADVVIATDHQDIYQTVDAFDGKAVMTSDSHQSGTDRLAEAADKLGLSEHDIVVNVQGDEPEIPVSVINQLAQSIVESGADVATLITPIENLEQLQDPNVVKVATAENGMALYFSRAPIPYDREHPDSNDISQQCFRHIGIYAYRVSSLQKFALWQQSPLEQLEKLEQLRFMEKGLRIQTAVALEVPPVGIDTEQDYQAACQRFTKP